MEKGKVKQKVVLIGGSAGSIEVLMKVLPELSPPLGYALVIVLHRKAGEDMMLEELVAMKTDIPVRELDDKTVLEEECIYIAPADYHLLFEDDNTLSLDISEKINYSRPSIDVAFESAAQVYGPNLTCILLSGANADGTQGLIAVRQHGGRIIIQAPHTAGMPFMPENALANVTPHYIMDAPQIIQFLNGQALS